MARKMISRVLEVARHRNGMCGAPFYAVTFLPTEGKETMLGVVFEADDHVAVFSVDTLARGVIAFGANSFRGDRFEPELRAAVREYEKSQEAA